MCRAAGALFLVAAACAAQDTLQLRLRLSPASNELRQESLFRLFQEAGCPDLRLHPLKGAPPNVVCGVPGTRRTTILVTAHFDKTKRGQGVLDNWSGASLLPSLVEALLREPRSARFVFIGFSNEERGLVGSRLYTRQMPPHEWREIRAVVNIDCVGAGPLKYWTPRADKGLAELALRVASETRIPLEAVRLKRVDTDSHPFARKKIPVIDFVSLTQPMIKLLHTPRDNFDIMRMEEYQNSFRLISAFLTRLAQED